MHGIESASSLQVLGGFGVGCWLLSLRVLRLRRGCWAASPYWDASLKVLRMPDEPAVTALFAGRDSFEDEAFADLDLSRGDLANREFLRCTFTNVRLPDADVRGARFDDCLFNGCDLSRARAANIAARGVVARPLPPDGRRPQ